MKNNKMIVWVSTKTVKSQPLKQLLLKGKRNDNGSGSVESYTFTDVSHEDSEKISTCPQIFIVGTTQISNGTFLELSWDSLDGSVEHATTGIVIKGKQRKMIDIFVLRKELNWSAIGSVKKEVYEAFLICMEKAKDVLDNLDNLKRNAFEIK